MINEPLLDEMALLAQARALDQIALGEVHRRYYAAIYRYITFRVPTAEVAEDLTSEVFTRFLVAIREKSAPQNSLRGWLYRVASHVIADYFRQQARNKETQLTDTLPSQGTTPEEIADSNLTNEVLRSALAELTDEQQAVLQLRYGGSMRFREVAEQLGKSENAVKQLQLRALAALHKNLLTRQEIR